MASFAKQLITIDVPVGDLDAISNTLGNYKEHFIDLVEYTNLKGFDKSSGSLGRVRSTAVGLSVRRNEKILYYALTGKVCEGAK